MEGFLTSKQVQDLLKVDRITVYRMLSDGRLKGVKIGQLWRFPRREVERVMGGEPAQPESSQPDPVFPTHCVQTIQDLFSDVSQIGALVVDLQGKQVTEVSRPTPFCQAILASQSGREACRGCWQLYARYTQARQFSTCHAGLQYLGAPILDKDQPVGVFLVGQFYWQPPDPAEEAARVQRLAAQHNIPEETLRISAQMIPVIDPAQRSRMEAWPGSAARAVQSILRERTGFVERLQQIANLTQLP
jgi:excisionase family DNA binding protein